MSDKIVRLVQNEMLPRTGAEAGEQVAEFFRELSTELSAELDPSMKICVVITTNAEDKLLRLRAHKLNANALEVQGMLSLAAVDYANQD